MQVGMSGGWVRVLLLGGRDLCINYLIEKALNLLFTMSCRVNKKTYSFLFTVSLIEVKTINCVWDNK